MVESTGYMVVKAFLALFTTETDWFRQRGSH